MKPIELINCSIRPTTINSYLIRSLEIDLKHINHGLDSEKGYGHKSRSNFSKEEVVQFFESLNGVEAESELDDNWEYFVIDKPFFEKRKTYRMVFCIDKKDIGMAGIITFFQINKGVK